MLLNVRKFICVEMIRDGGSFALKFENGDGNRYILFTKIRLAAQQEKEISGWGEPVVIDCDPAKRPQDTDRIIYSELSGPASQISWHVARQILDDAETLAQGLTRNEAEWLRQMTLVADHEGRPPDE